MIKILICGDSYCVTDPAFPGKHWSEHILNRSADYQVINLAHGGCSNALILLQLLQGLRFNPDFVIMSFTGDNRFEYDLNKNSLPRDLGSEEIAHYLKSRYTTSAGKDFSKNRALFEWLESSASENFEKLKNYFYVINCLTILDKYKIPFCYSLGGLEYKQDYTNFLRSNYLHNVIDEYQEQRLNINLWYHGQDSVPVFHINDDQVLELFANECISKVENITC